MPNPTNFTFCNPNYTCLQCIGSFSPVQTLLGNNNWCYSNTEPVNLRGLNAVRTDGTLWLWGCNFRGQLGNNNTISQSSPIQTVSQGNNWKQVSGSDVNTAAVKTDGTLWLWGCNSRGQLGNNNISNQSSPVQTVSQGTNWKQVSTAIQHTAAIKTDGTLWLWGYGFDGRLGNGCGGFNTERSSPVQTVSQGTNWCQVSITCGVSAAIKTDGTLWLWGDNTSGILGNNRQGIFEYRSSPVQTVSQGTNWCQVYTSAYFVGAVKTDGTLWMWGSNAVGQLGNNNTINRSSPVQTVSLETNWSRLFLTCDVSYATKTDGTLWTWSGTVLRTGRCDYLTRTSSPSQVFSQATNWSEISPGPENSLVTMGVKSDGTLWTWGSDTTGELGVFPSVFPRAVDFDDVFVRKDLFLEGGLWNWGENNYGQLGNNNTINRSSPAQTVTGGTNWKTIYNYSGIKSDGTLWLWGNNQYGKVGNNDTIDISSPAQTIAQGSDWRTISDSENNTAAIKDDGSLWTWGYNCFGQLGINLLDAQSSPVQTVSTGKNWRVVSVGLKNIASIKTDGTLWIWGSNDNGQLGNNDTISRSSPVQTISNATTWRQVSVGDSLTGAVKTDGTLWTWGLNSNGQLGSNNTISQSSPVQTISTATTWKQVSVGSVNSAAIKTDGTLWTWGNNTFGQLGDNSTVTKSSPVQTVTMGYWRLVCVAANNNSTVAAIKPNGSLWLWGHNGNGQLGIDGITHRSSPVQTISQGTNWRQVSLGISSVTTLREDCW